MKIVCQQTILMKYHASFVFLKKVQDLKLSSAANYRWRFIVSTVSSPTHDLNKLTKQQTNR